MKFCSTPILKRIGNEICCFKEPEDIETYEIKLNLGIYKRQQFTLFGHSFYLVYWTWKKRSQKWSTGGVGRTKLVFIGLYFGIFRRKMPWSLFLLLSEWSAWKYCTLLTNLTDLRDQSLCKLKLWKCVSQQEYDKLRGQARPILVFRKPTETVRCQKWTAELCWKTLYLLTFRDKALNVKIPQNAVSIRIKE